ncbi:hypothetical protein LX64_02530 [Chitinophaga skermanii]|uniref:PKD domain-containing protein n=1 Tax=Chitinophaga skermanii TaxID=331697 RepID=A0A327QNZ3_9BACT|nr:PKD domain-containing protein [Chitinophaga skermanii]RAJ05372.1 hypothetical protein LX64_02530 [Chitinophaga skermanii]
MKKSIFNTLVLCGTIAFSACQKESLQTTNDLAQQKAIVPSKVGTVRAATLLSSPLISTVYSYLPAPGQFINEASFGTPTAAAGLVGSTSNIVSLGGYGGYVVFGFDHSVTNGTGADIGIYGNPLGPTYQWSEPGIVMVSQDTNNNGIPDDTWYELAGSQYSAASTIKNYKITYYNPGTIATNVLWRDNQGATGYVYANAYHTSNNYYPTFAPNLDSISFTGTKVANTLVTGTIITNPGYAWGYADNYATDHTTYGYNTFDISWAVNSAGTSVSLTHIDFVKVYTAQNCAAGPMLGEISTEIKGARDLHL